MFTEIVLFDLPDGMTREQLVAGFHVTAPQWQANPDLIRKNYLYDPEGQRGGGVYLWRDREAPARWHDEAWLTAVEKRLGCRPRIQVFETPVLVDNKLGETLLEEPVPAE